jgi:hypothetical protein
MSAYARERALDRIAELAGRGHDLVTFWRESSEAIGAAVPFYLVPCLFTLDPASLLVTSHYQEGFPRSLTNGSRRSTTRTISTRWPTWRGPRGMATLHEATGGDLSRSPRYRTGMQPYGAEQEVLTGLRTQSGEVWGCLGPLPRTGPADVRRRRA